MSKANYSRKQLALRRLLTDGRGGLNADAKCLVADLRRFCKAGRTTQYSAVTGAVDVNATMLALGGRKYSSGWSACCSSTRSRY